MPFGDLTVSEGRLVKWYRRAGEAISAGEHVADIETDKAVVEIELPRSGILAQILAEEGATVPMGASIGIVQKEALMRIVLSQFVHPNNDIERAALPHGAEMFVQARSSGKWEPLPPEIRATAEGIVHFPPGTSVDGSPEDYPFSARSFAAVWVSTALIWRVGGTAELPSSMCRTTAHRKLRTMPSRSCWRLPGEPQPITSD